jgi:putative sugar O-methyltransferase
MIQTSITDIGYYKEICKLACEDDNCFKKFKREPRYRHILEHVSKTQGRAYLKVILKESKDLLKFLEKFKENDIYGNPFTYFYFRTGKISPTTLRYIKVLSDLRKLFGNLNNMDIVEIGGGYGGQCKIISDVFSFNSYTLVDLDIVLKLTKKYLTKLNVNKVKYSTQDKLGDDIKCDLLISNYAFSECNKVVQYEYIRKILNKSKRGYITYNCIYSKAYTKEEIIEILSLNHNINILEEIPNMRPSNFILVWDDTVSK